MNVLIISTVSFNIINKNNIINVNNNLRSKIYMIENNINELDISWEKTNSCSEIIKNYFSNMNIRDYNKNDKNIYGEIFKYKGIPTSLVIINDYCNSIEEIILNKSLILMFDTGPILRSSFYDKFKKKNLKNTLNKEAFLII